MHHVHSHNQISKMIKLLAIGLGGFIGALLRYWVSGWAYAHTQSDFPLGTLVVNVAGSLILGLVMGLSEHYIFHPHVRLFLTIGFLGAFTTFSTFSYETIMLLQISSFMKAFLNITLSILLGFPAAFLGLALGRAI